MSDREWGAQGMSEDLFNEMGLAEQHPSAGCFDFRVAPTTTDTYNKLVLRPVVVACWRLNRPAFDFDSSFILPEARKEFLRLRELLRANPGDPAAIFGHTDPSGSDDYNKKLSGRRARAVYAALIRDMNAWLELYSNPEEHDKWGLRSTQHALSALCPKGEVSPYYLDGVDGLSGPNTDSAIRAFQKDMGLRADGIVGPDTRKALYCAYMDWLCGAPEDRFAMAPKDFVGDGQDPEAKGAVQGCGEFNPVYLLSRSEDDAYRRSGNSGERNLRNGPDRRVNIFLFRRATVLPLAEWPCPSISEGASGCRANFYPDGEQRRQPGPRPRTYRVDKHTMACSIYDQLARSSPCEGGVLSDPFELHVAGVADGGNVVIRNASGEVIRSVPACDVGRWRDRNLHIVLDPRDYPVVCSVHLEHDSESLRIVGPCSLLALSTALRAKQEPIATEIAFPPRGAI